MSPKLEEDQARIVLEFRRTVYAENIDLFATFTQLAPEKEMCVAGPTEPECGSMVYHGDSSYHHIGKTTEAITISALGVVDYLVFLNREIPSDLSS